MGLGGSAPCASHLYPGKDPVPILQEAGWAPGQVWTGGKSRPDWDSNPDLPARSQSLYRLSYPAPLYFATVIKTIKVTNSIKSVDYNVQVIVTVDDKIQSIKRCELSAVIRG